MVKDAKKDWIFNVVEPQELVFLKTEDNNYIIYTTYENKLSIVGRITMGVYNKYIFNYDHDSSTSLYEKEMFSISQFMRQL